MKVIINKKPEILQDGTLVGELLKQRDNNRASVWVNGKQLLKADFATFEIKDADEIKIFRILAGG
jgi:thiamine biosynthesis protein ThiS